MEIDKDKLIECSICGKSYKAGKGYFVNGKGEHQCFDCVRKKNDAGIYTILDDEVARLGKFDKEG